MLLKITTFIFVLPGIFFWGCSEAARQPLEFTAIGFNTGTSEGIVPENEPNGGYTSQKAAYSDQYYGDGLAFLAVVEDTRLFPLIPG